MEAVGGFRLLVVAADALCCIFLLKLVELPVPPLFDAQQHGFPCITSEA